MSLLFLGEKHVYKQRDWLQDNNKLYHLLPPNVKPISDVREASMLKIITEESHVTKQMSAQI